MILTRDSDRQRQIIGHVWRHENASTSVAGFILRTKIYAVYADYFAHVGRVLSAIYAYLRRSDRADGKYKHFYNKPTFTMNCARLLKLC